MSEGSKKEAPRMQKVKIYGASDDLVEVDGDVDGADEFCCEEGVIAFAPSGDLFHVKYGEDGVWDITHKHASGRLQVSIIQAPTGDDPEPYTDVAMVSGDIHSVRFWKSWPPSITEIRERIMKRLDEWSMLSDDTVKRVWEALGSP